MRLRSSKFLESPQAFLSRIPPEIVAEIVRHNANNVSSLCAMAQASKALRSFAIEHVFSAIHFTCAQDITRWDTMLSRTPQLQHIVKKIKFSYDGIKRYGRARFQQPLHQGTVPPKIPIMPNVHVVEWKSHQYSPIDQSMAIAYMALFPNTTELCLTDMYFDGFDKLAAFLHACGRLRVLCFRSTRVKNYVQIDRENPVLKVDLTRLEDLRATGKYNDFAFLTQLVEASQPTEIKSLTFSVGLYSSTLATKKLVRLASPSLVSLSLLLDSSGLGG
ncbi:hypothetical protein K438DRAFT_614223 [Mycena galopus ATCC 62051]|nr:hypothetical protein K438DRAFT_614223 [Mycena galopus ATCC 62051]